jgi:hypothetical protein
VQEFVVLRSYIILLQTRNLVRNLSLSDHFSISFYVVSKLRYPTYLVRFRSLKLGKCAVKYAEKPFKEFHLNETEYNFKKISRKENCFFHSLSIVTVKLSLIFSVQRGGVSVQEWALHSSVLPLRFRQRLRRFLR